MAGTEAPDVLEPIQQDTIPFYGRELLAVRLADGRIAAGIRWLCEGLGLDVQAQTRRIRRTKAIRGELLNVRIATPGGTQVAPALTLRALPFWLAGIDTSRLAPELEPVILAYQLECVDVLYRHFAERPRELATPDALVSSTPIEKPERPEREADALTWAEYHEAMAHWLRWQADINAWRGEVESRLEAVEEISRIVPEILERLGPATLTPERQASVRAAVKRLHDLSGVSYGAIYSELAGSFHVARYQDLREADWSHIAEWFTVRIEAAEKRSDHTRG